jgi:hypothetical protein
MSDRDNLPRPAPDVVEDGIPATEELPPGQLATGDTLEGEMPPLDHPQGVTAWGTTADEQLAGEPLDVRLAREIPDVDTGEILLGGTILEPGAEGGLVDEEADLIGELDPGFEDTLTAEEAAVRVVDEPPGMNYDPDPGYVEVDEGR